MEKRKKIGKLIKGYADQAFTSIIPSFNKSDLQCYTRFAQAGTCIVDRD